MSSETCDIIISTYGRGTSIDATISSIRANTHKNFVLWVLDQNSDNRTAKPVLRHAAEDSRIRYLRAPLRGLAPTRNMGATLGTAPYLLFTNDDCNTDINWIAAMLNELRNPDTWAVFGRVLPDEQAQGVDKQVLATKLSQRRKVYQRNRFDLSFGHGHNLGLRREHFVALGGFDELLGQGGVLGAWEDRDLGYRVLRKGGRIVYSPAVVLQHCHIQDWQAASSRYREYGIGAGAAISKYLRCGDVAALALLLEWQLSQGLRQILSGLIKWRRWEKVRIGAMQFAYPWLGFARGFRHNCDCKQIRYTPAK